MRAHPFAVSATIALLLLPACQAVAPAGTAPGAPATSGPAPASAVQAAGAIAGLVADAAGKPVAGAHLLIVGHGAKAEATSGPDGRFRAEVPAGGAYDVVATAHDGAHGLVRGHATGTAAAGEPAPMTVRVAPPGGVTGRVLVESDEGTAPAAGAELHLAEVPGASTHADADGRFHLADAPDGVWTLVAQRPGARTARLARIVVKDGREVTLFQPITLKREANGEVRGSVRDAGGQAVPGAVVTVWPAAGPAAGSRLQARTDGAGAFVVPGLAAGAYHVQVARRGLPGAGRREVTVPAAGAADAGAFALAGTLARATVAGQVVDAAGQGVAGLAVRVPASGAAPATTDASGNFTLRDVAYGDYGLDVAGPHVAHTGQDLHVGAADVRLPAPLVVHAAHADGEAPVGQVLGTPVVTVHAGLMTWPPVARPAAAGKVVYDVEVETAPGTFTKVGTVQDGHAPVPSAAEAGAQVRVRARVESAPYEAAYRVAMAAMLTGGSTSKWRYGLLSADAGAAPAIATMDPAVASVSQLVTDGAKVYALGSTSLPTPTAPNVNGALAVAGVGETSAFQRLYTHDRSLSLVLATGMEVSVFGTREKLRVTADGQKADVRAVAGAPTGQEWGDAISGSYVHLPNMASWFDASKPKWLPTVRIAPSYVLTAPGDAHSVSSFATPDVKGLFSTLPHPSAMALAADQLFVMCEDGRYPGAKMLARYNAGTGAETNLRTDPLDQAKLGIDPSQLHGDQWGAKIYVLNSARSKSANYNGVVLAFDKDLNQKAKLDTPNGWRTAGMCVARDTMSNTVWVGYNEDGVGAHIRKFVGDALVKTVDLPGKFLTYSHQRQASVRLMAATDDACWAVTDANKIVRVQ